MILERIDLYELFSLPREEKTGGYLTCYAHEYMRETLKAKVHPALLLIPGGGYGMISEREGDPVALKFLAEGFSVFRLEYTVHAKFPVPLIEAAMAMIYIRTNEKRYLCDKEKVVAMGFSAGGHLAGMLSTLCFDESLRSLFHEKCTLVRPDAVCLSYPVITMESGVTHQGTADTITGNEPALVHKLSLENAVTSESSPAFIWHTVTDGLVPVENSLRMASACQKAGVPFELHLFGEGPHGLSLCETETAWAEGDELVNEQAKTWISLLLNWLKKRGFEVKIPQ